MRFVRLGSKFGYRLKNEVIQKIREEAQRRHLG